MLTSHGVILGYNGVAAVDDKHQIIVGAEAFGQGPENNLLKPMIESVTRNLGEPYTKESKVTADSGFHCADSVDYCFDQNLDAYIADGNFRKRDPRFIDRDRYHPKARKARWFKADDFPTTPIPKPVAALRVRPCGQVARVLSPATATAPSRAISTNAAIALY